MKFDVVDPGPFTLIQQTLHLVILLFAPFVCPIGKCMTNMTAAGVVLIDIGLLSSVAVCTRCVSLCMRERCSSYIFLTLMHQKIKNKDCSQGPNLESVLSPKCFEEESQLCSCFAYNI